MLKMKSTFLAIVAAAVGVAQSTKNTTGGILPGLYADPNIAVFGCDYYIYPTTDGRDWP